MKSLGSLFHDALIQEQESIRMLTEISGERVQT